jgi:hypothetical protein
MYYKFQFFGSKSSIDYDVMVFIETIPDSVEVCKDICEMYDRKISTLLEEHNLPIKKVNTNLAVIKDGVVIDIHKGMICECNNSLYYTYDNFYQINSNQIKKTISRDIDLKILRCYRILLSFLSRSVYREEVKKGLRGVLSKKIDVLLNIDYENINFGDRNGQPIDIWKSLSFQVGQTLLLVRGIETYSKEDIYKELPLLKGFLMRNVEDYDFNCFKQYLFELSTYILANKTYLLGKNENSWIC